MSSDLVAKVVAAVGEEVIGVKPSVSVLRIAFKSL